MMISSRRAMVAALFLISCGDPSAPPQQGLPPGPGEPGVHVLSGESVTDTALALAPQPMVVRVRGADGEPLAGVTLQARGLPHDTLPSRVSMVVAPAFTDSEAAYATLVSTTSDANGYAQFAIRLGAIAGNGAIEVRATSPEASGLPRDTARFTIRPGQAAVLVVAPRDTAVFVGGVAQSRVRVADQHGNAVVNPPAVSYEAASTQVTVNATGAVTGAALGRAWVRVRAIGILDSLAVTVVPPGTIAAYNLGFGPPLGGRGTVIAVNVDGSDIRTLVPSGGSGSGDAIPDWDATGTRIVIDVGPSGQRLYTYTVGGTAQRVMTAANGLTEEFRPQYSSDGWIYFVGRAGGIGIYRVRPDGTGLVRVTTATPGGQETHPSPSPDGTRVVVMSTDFSGCTCTESFALRILDVATGVSSPMNVGGFWPRWSPAGDLIAFLNGAGAVSVVAPDGSGRRAVSGAGRPYDGPIDWSPDGKWIVATSSSFESPGLHLIEVATSQTLPLAFTTGLRNPAWRP
jgi:hypothetical protein